VKFTVELFFKKKFKNKKSQNFCVKNSIICRGKKKKNPGGVTPDIIIIIIIMIIICVEIFG
jgi:hypothetical protein